MPAASCFGRSKAERSLSVKDQSHAVSGKRPERNGPEVSFLLAGYYLLDQLKT